MTLELKDLVLAYRKAKVDLYYSSHASLEAIVNYEENLHSNLAELLERIKGEDESWSNDTKFIGDWTLAPKSVVMPSRTENGLIFSSPADEWTHYCNHLESEKPKAEFRVMAQCSLDFHVFSTLWMLKIGYQFDAKLTNCAYGNRLRLTQDRKKINDLSLGSFQPYLKPFRDWRDNGIKAMRTALDAEKNIVALTADVSSFYHELNPSFMLNATFLKDVLELSLSEEQSKLHRLFIQALKTWAENSPLKKGLPVGLPASAIVANLALVELDRIIEQQCAPLYYGRYVDDILLVMENTAGFRSTGELWEWLFARSNNNLAWVNGEKDKQIVFQPKYLSDSNIHFANAKNKVFILAGDSGKTLVDAIAHQIQERASEWRAMPRLPRLANNVGTDLLAATQSDGETADNLRKADALTMRRAGFAIKLRDFEAYERDLLPDVWCDHRNAFFRAFIQHVLVLPQFFDLAVYLPRVIRLATICEDFKELYKILRALEIICEQVNRSCTLNIKACSDPTQPPDISLRWVNQLFRSVLESMKTAFPSRLSRKGKQEWKEYMATYSPNNVWAMMEWPINGITDKYFQEQQSRFFSFDLAHLPFRFIGLPKEMVVQRGIPPKNTITYCSEVADLLPQIKTGNKKLAQWIGLKDLPSGLFFATRPFSLPELFIVNKNAYKEDEQIAMQEVILAVRGFTLGKYAPVFDKRGVLTIADGYSNDQHRIAVSSWKTNLSSWAANVSRMPDPDVERYARLCHLLDGVIAQPHGCRYLILPELALPAHWFIRVARKLQGRGISLITGIEYLHVKKASVRNQVWAALSHDGLGFPSLMIYRQDKQRAALHEEHELQRLAGLEIIPEKSWNPPHTPPIIQHGNFRFSLLVCSELTNINYRAKLRGKIDALFVPEWNQDTETFNALVESSALDIHAYIIQCNDRQYGDSRIRAPFKDSWKRDILRVKGGVTDYCVIGEIDVQKLREFQSSHRSPETPFKPVPDGFEIDYGRRVLPLKEI